MVLDQLGIFASQGRLTQKAGATFQLDCQKLLNSDGPLINDTIPILPSIKINLVNLYGEIGNMINPTGGTAQGFVNNAGSSVTEISCTNNVQTFTGDASGVGLDLSISLISGHHYYIFGYQKNSGTNTIGSHFRIYANTTTKKSSNVVIGDIWHVVSADYTADGTETHIKICPTVGGCRVDNKLFFMMDITTLGFSKERMDDILIEQMTIGYVNQREVSLEMNTITLKNLYPEVGSFSTDVNNDGLADGWSGWSSDNYSFIDGVQTFTATGTYGQIYPTDRSKIQGIGKRWYFYILTKGIVRIRAKAAGAATTDNISRPAGDDFMPITYLGTNIDDTLPSIFVESSISSGWEPIQVTKAFFFEIPSSWGTDTVSIKAWLDKVVDAEMKKGYITERTVRNSALMMNTAMTRISGFRNFDKRILKFRNVAGPYGNFTVDTNGDGLADGWSRHYANTAQSVSNNIQSFTPTVQWGNIITNTVINQPMRNAMQNGDTVWVGVLVKTTDSGVHISAVGATPSNSSYYTGSGTWQLLSLYSTITNKDTFYILLETSKSSAWVEIQVQKLMVSIVSKDYVGETLPTKAELDNMVQDWFDANSGYFDNQPDPNLLRPTIHFDGVDDFILMMNSLGIDFTSAPFAINITFKVDANIPTGDWRLFYKGNNANSPQYELVYSGGDRNLNFISQGSYLLQTVVGDIPKNTFKSVTIIGTPTTLGYCIDQGTYHTRSWTNVLPSKSGVIFMGRRSNLEAFKWDLANFTIFIGEKALDTNVFREASRISKPYIIGGE
jgi:hypothetical protein